MMVSKIIFHHDIIQTDWVEYAFNILCSSLDCDIATQNSMSSSDDAAIIFVSYGLNIPVSIYRNHLHIFADVSFWENLGQPESLPISPMYRFPLCDLQLIANERLENPLICPYVHKNQHPKPVYWQKMDFREGCVLICK